MSTILANKTIDKKITTFGHVRIDDLFFSVVKDESSGITCYYITVEPNNSGGSSSVVSSGAGIGSDDEAIKFLERLEELKQNLKLASF